MENNKHVEEMYKDVYDAINHNAVLDVIHGGYIGVDTEGLTRELYNDGYRKASDVVEEIKKHILEGASTIKSENSDCLYGAKFAIEEVVLPILEAYKKKYTEERK